MLEYSIILHVVLQNLITSNFSDAIGLLKIELIQLI